MQEAELPDTLKVLVVEDDEAIRSLVGEALSDGGFQPSIAASGEVALSLLSKDKYDLLVLDIKLGRDGITGWHVARRARAITLGLPVIYITGAAADEWAVQGVAKSIILSKPFAPAQLICAVSELLTAAHAGAISSVN
jgi:DNA-binding response OmpR family regulator